jgi:hypothetical protein
MAKRDDKKVVKRDAVSRGLDLGEIKGLWSLIHIAEKEGLDVYIGLTTDSQKWDNVPGTKRDDHRAVRIGMGGIAYHIRYSNKIIVVRKPHDYIPED